MNLLKKTQVEYNILLNQLLVVYAFTFPIKHYANSTAFFLILCVFLLRGNFKENLKKIFENNIAVLFLLYIMMHYIWFIGSENSNNIKDIAHDLRYAMHFLLFVTFIKKEYLFKILYGLLLGVFFSEIMSYLIYFDLIPHSLYFYNEKIYDATPYDPTPFVNHVNYGIFLSFAIGILFYQILTLNKFNFLTIISYVFFITISVNMFLQGSRTGYILYFLIILFTLFYVYRKKAIKFLIPLIISFGIIILLLYNNFNTFQKRIDQTLIAIEKVFESQNYNSSIGARIGFYVHGFEVIQENFWFGVGTADVMDELKLKYANDSHHLKQLNDPHSDFLFTFLKFGVFGFIFFLYFFYKIFTFRQEDDFYNFILKSGSFIIFIAMIQGSYFKGWMILFFVLILTIGTTKTEQNYNKTKVQLDKNELLFYGLLIIFCYVSAFAKTFKFFFK